MTTMPGCAPTRETISPGGPWVGETLTDPYPFVGDEPSGLGEDEQAEVLERISELCNGLVDVVLESQVPCASYHRHTSEVSVCVAHGPLLDLDAALRDVEELKGAAGRLYDELGVVPTVEQVVAASGYRQR